MTFVYQGFVRCLVEEDLEHFVARVIICGRDHASKPSDQWVSGFENLDDVAPGIEPMITVRRRYDDTGAVVFEADDIELVFKEKLTKKPCYVIIATGEVAVARFAFFPTKTLPHTLSLRWDGSVSGKGGQLIRLNPEAAQ